MTSGKLIFLLILHLVLARSPPNELLNALYDSEDALDLNEDKSEQIAESLRNPQKPVQKDEEFLETILEDSDENEGEDVSSKENVDATLTGEWSQHWTSDRRPDDSKLWIQSNQEVQELATQAVEILDCAEDLPSYRSYTGPLCGLDNQQTSQQDNVEVETGIQESEDDKIQQTEGEAQNTEDQQQNENNDETQESPQSWATNSAKDQHLWDLLTLLEEGQNSKENVLNTHGESPGVFRGEEQQTSDETESLELNNNQNQNQNEEIEFVKGNQGQLNQQYPEQSRQEEPFERQSLWITGQHRQNSNNPYVSQQSNSNSQRGYYRPPSGQNEKLGGYRQHSSNNPQLSQQEPERLILQESGRNSQHSNIHNLQTQDESEDYYPYLDYDESQSNDSPSQVSGQTSNSFNPIGQSTNSNDKNFKGGSIRRPVGPQIPDNTYPNQRHAFSCKGRHEGFYPDFESNCYKFYRCAPPDPRTFSFTCGAGTKFDVTLNVCNHEAKVRCQKSFPDFPLY